MFTALSPVAVPARALPLEMLAAGAVENTPSFTNNADLGI